MRNMMGTWIQIVKRIHLNVKLDIIVHQGQAFISNAVQVASQIVHLCPNASLVTLETTVLLALIALVARILMVKIMKLVF